VSFTDLDQGREILSRFSLPKSMKHSVGLTPTSFWKIKIVDIVLPFGKKYRFPSLPCVPKVEANIDTQMFICLLSWHALQNLSKL
jgi:hypothetical protein